VSSMRRWRKLELSIVYKYKPGRHRRRPEQVTHDSPHDGLSGLIEVSKNTGTSVNRLTGRRRINLLGGLAVSVTETAVKPAAVSADGCVQSGRTAVNAAFGKPGAAPRPWCGRPDQGW
jgi:hypothetical protein